MVINSEKNYSSIESQIEEEFTHISDFIWKNNRLILEEKKREEKIFSMYRKTSSDDMIAATFRWKYESFKINKIFPYLTNVSNLFDYFRKKGVNLEKVTLFKQIQASIKIRNCFFHASGVISWSKDDIELKNIVKNKLYFDNKEKENPRINTDQEWVISIVESDFGQQLQLTHNYTFILSNYIKIFLKDLCCVLGKKYE